MWPHSLPCETLVTDNNRLYDKLQDSVATYLRCGGVVNNQVKKVYCSVSVKKLKSVNIWQSYQQDRWLSHALCVPGHHTAERTETSFTMKLKPVSTNGSRCKYEILTKSSVCTIVHPPYDLCITRSCHLCLPVFL